MSKKGEKERGGGGGVGWDAHRGFCFQNSESSPAYLQDIYLCYGSVHNTPKIKFAPWHSQHTPYLIIILKLIVALVKYSMAVLTSEGRNLAGQRSLAY